MYNNETLSNMNSNLQHLIPYKKDSDKKSVYIAGPWFTEKSKLFMNFMKTMYDNVTAKVDCYFPYLHQSKTPKDVYTSNIDAIQDATEILAFVSEKDVGTAFEIGFAKASGKDVWLIVYDIDDIKKSKTNLMLALGTKIITPKQLEDYFKKSNAITYYTISGDSWGGIE